jgi:hypothetical protein
LPLVCGVSTVARIKLTAPSTIPTNIGVTNPVCQVVLRWSTVRTSSCVRAGHSYHARPLQADSLPRQRGPKPCYDGPTQRVLTFAWRGRGAHRRVQDRACKIDIPECKEGYPGVRTPQEIAPILPSAENLSPGRA